MAESQGSISYTTDIDTSDTLAAEKVMDKATDNIVNDFKKVDTQVAKTGTQMTKTSKAVKTGLASMSKGAGQAGIQIQQFVGQIQGGQSAMLAFSQQSADLGFVLGFPLLGAVAGISASLAGILITSLGGAADATENLEEKLKKLIETTTLTEEQAAVLVASENEQIKARAKTVKSLNEVIAKTEAALKASDGLLSRTDKESKHYDAIAKGNEKVRNELNKNVAARQLLEAETKKSTENIALYESVVGNKSVTANKAQQESIDAVIDSLLEQSNMLGLTKREQLLMTLAAQGATFVDLEQAAAIYDKIEAFDAEAEAIKKRANEQEKADAQEASAIKKRANEQKKADAQEASAKKSGASFAGGVIKKGMTEVERLEEEHAKLTELKEKFKEDDKLYQEALTANEQMQTDKRLQMKQEEADAIMQNNQLILSSAGDLFGSLAGLLSASGDEQSAAYKTMFALSKAFAVASAGLNLSLAISQASTLPYPSNLPAMAQAAAAGGQLVGAISGAAFSGGRQFGGDTNSGSNYRINESGQPEIYSQGGKDFLMNSGGGKVTPMDKFEGGGNGDVNVSIENYGAPVDASVEKISPNNIKIVLNALTDQVNRNQGGFMKAMKQNTNIQTKAGGR